MSLGVGGYADLAATDDKLIIYEYGAFNWDIPECINEENIKDGIITIERDCFLEPEIHSKIKKMPSKRKRLITKKVTIDVDYETTIDKEKIKIENCSTAWQYTEKKHIDIMALQLLRKLLYQYQIDGKIPENISIFK